MFIGTEQNSIKQFFSDIGFIPPQGMKLDYFILPPNANVGAVAPPSLYPAENVRQDPKRGTTLVYQPKDPTKVHSDPKTKPVEAIPVPLPYTPAPLTPPQVDGMPKQVMSPEVRNRVAVVESTRDHVDARLTESIGEFPKGTLFHFRRA